ncbi:MAG: hypothetical protein ACI8RZ_002195, partial [Myxococcota bacterium]
APSPCELRFAIVGAILFLATSLKSPFPSVWIHPLAQGGCTHYARRSPVTPNRTPVASPLDDFAQRTQPDTGIAQIVMIRSMLAHRRSSVEVISPLPTIFAQAVPIFTKFVAFAI